MAMPPSAFSENRPSFSLFELNSALVERLSVACWASVPRHSFQTSN
jgi:hypothetical protein